MIRAWRLFASDELIAWLDDHAPRSYTRIYDEGLAIIIEDAATAVHFKLRWGDSFLN